MLLAGALGIGYAAYRHYIDETVSLKLTQKIAQEIKHQMMIISINFSEGISKHSSTNQNSDKEKITAYFTDEMTKIYKQKEDLILSKYQITTSVYKNSLNRYKRGKKLIAI